MKLKFITILSLSFILLLSACGKSDADLQAASAKAAKEKAPTATVVVKDGVATVTGVAADEAEKAAAGTAAKVEGVKEVKNEMTVKPVAPVAVADNAAKTAVEDALKKKGFDKVTVEATTTEVIIRGNVPKGKMGEVNQTVQEVAKRKVTNQVTEEK